MLTGFILSVLIVKAADAKAKEAGENTLIQLGELIPLLRLEKGEGTKTEIAFKLIIKAIKESKKGIKAFGSTQALSGNDAILDSYFDATHKKVNELRLFKGFKYQRMSALAMFKQNDSFKEHLEKLLDLNSENVLIRLLNQPNPLYCYIIVDSKTILLSLLTKTGSNPESVFYFHNEKITKHFENHFDSLWKELEDSKIGWKICSKVQLNDSIAFYNNYKDKLLTFAQSLASFPSRKIEFRKHLQEKVGDLATDLSGFENDIIQHRLFSSNQRDLVELTKYFSKLENGCSYETIAFEKLWASLYSHPELFNKFRLANEKAISYSIDFKRVFIFLHAKSLDEMDSKRISDFGNPSFNGYHKSIVETALKWNIVNRLHHNNFKLGVLFLDEELYRTYENIDQINYSMFKLQNEYHIFERTKHNNMNVSRLSPYLRDNCDLINEKRNKFELVKGLMSSRTRNDDDEKFLISIIDAIKTENNELNIDSKTFALKLLNGDDFA